MLTESRRWWKATVEEYVNGLVRAARKQVGADGNSNRYDESACWCVITIKVAAVYPVPLWGRFLFFLERRILL
jgi:hypothetical protein